MTTELNSGVFDEEASLQVSLSESKDASANGSASNTPRRRRDSIMKQRSGMANRDNVKKSVCFSTAPDLRITAADDCFKLMCEGSEFIKLRKTDRQYLRNFYLTEPRDELVWYPTKKPAKARLRIDEVKEIRAGRNTPLLRAHEYATRYNEDCQFSIVYGDEYSSLDLIARTPELANVWVAGLNALLAQRNDVRRRKTSSCDVVGGNRQQVLSFSHNDEREAEASAENLGATVAAADSNSLGNGAPVISAARALSCPTSIVPNRTRKPSEAYGGGEPPIGENDAEVNAKVNVYANTNGKSDGLLGSKHDNVIFEVGDCPAQPAPASASISPSADQLLSAGPCSNCAGYRDRWLRETFQRADVQHCGVLRESEAFAAMRTAGFDVCPSRLRRKMMEVDASRDEEERGLLNVEQFVKLCKELFTRPDIYFLLTRYARNAEYLTVDEFSNFLEAEQKVKQSAEEVGELMINRFEPTTDGKEHRHLGIDGLTNYLMSTDGDIFDQRHTRVCQDMNQPLSHYFVSASHKTYLIEDQINGPCSIDGYVHALQRGCRYIEIDVYDGENEEPIVTRSPTKSSTLTLNSALEAISKHAFIASEYPLIIGLEVRCSLRQQLRVAELLKSQFGNRLCTEIIEDKSTLPSPEALIERILIKSKRIDLSAGALCIDSSSGIDIEYGFVSNDADGLFDSDRLSAFRKETRRCVARVLSDLFSCLKTSSFRSFDAPYEIGEVCTLPEKTALAVLTTRGDQMVNWCKTSIACVSPDSSRVDSSNFPPHEFWACGCQLAMLNWQSPGMALDVNVGFFRQNGNCGYVLKPSVMRDPIATFQPAFTNASPDITTKLCTIKILSAQQLPKPKGSTARGDFIEPFIVVQCFGVSADCSQQRTRTVEYDGSAAQVNESFDIIASVPQLATLRFLILDDNSLGDDFIAQYSAPLECFRVGYRHIPLYSYDGLALSGAKLFVHVTITSVDALSKAALFTGRRKMAVGRVSSGQLSPSGSMKQQPVHERSKSTSTTVRKALRTVSSSTVRTLVEPRPTGAKFVDELFTSTSQSLHRAAEHREAVNGAFAQLRESCGLSPSASAKQCVKYLLNALLQSSQLQSQPPTNLTRSVVMFVDTNDSRRMRITSSNSTSNNSVTLSNVAPLADALEQILQLTNKLIEQCNYLLFDADVLLDSLNHCYQRAVEFHETVAAEIELELPPAVQSSRQRLCEQRLENYRWNVRVVKAQAESLATAKSECLQILEQIIFEFEQQAASSSSSNCVFISRVSALPGTPETAARSEGNRKSRKTSLVERIRSSVVHNSNSLPRMPISRTLSRDELD